MAISQQVGSVPYYIMYYSKKQRIREVRRALSVLKVDTKEVKDISFVGKQVCAILTTSVYAPTLIKKIVLDGSTITT